MGCSSATPLPVPTSVPSPWSSALTTTPTAAPVVSARLRWAGWGLHLYTASGTALALFAVIAATDGAEVRALWILFAALVIDGSDGMLARRLRVKETIPGFDGARLDDIVDYITYAFVPMVLLWRGGYLPEGILGAVLAVVPLLASSFQFCRVDAKTDDHFFLGFPSYWNVVAFYVIVLGLDPGVTSAILLICTVLVFVPIKYVYPSRTRTFRGLNLTLATLWMVTYAVLLLQVPDPSPVVVALSLLYVAYYVVVSAYLTVVGPRRARAVAP